MNETPTSAPVPAQTQNGLSTTSLVLGILSCLGLSCLTGIPAVITGHVAFARAKKNPQIYGGSGLALAGLILGYAGTVLVTVIAILASLMLPALAKAKGKAQSISCVNNMKQIGLGARLYANDHGDKLPPDFLSMSNELVTPKILVCNGDSTRTKAADWAQFNAAANVSYEFLLPGTKEEDVVSKTVFRCPIHGHIGLGDGSVQQVRPAARQ